jgi:hypothetical protein
MKTNSREIIIPELIVGIVHRYKAKGVPAYQTDNAKRQLEDIRAYIDKALKN